MIKKIITLAVVFMFLSFGTAFASEGTQMIAAKNAFCVKVNGEYIQADNYYIDGKLYIPLRAVFETMGSSVLWDGETKSVKIISGDSKSDDYLGNYTLPSAVYSEVTVYKDSVILSANGEYISADTFILNDKTYIDSVSLENITAHTYVDLPSRTARIYSDDYKELKDDEAAVYGENQTVNYTQFADISKFIYGDISTAVAQNFSEVDNYLLLNYSVGKISDDLKLTVSEEEIKAFSEEYNVDKTVEEAGIEDKEFFYKNVVKDYVIREKITNLNLGEIYDASDEELQSYYQELNESQGLWIKAQHILVSKGENGEGLEKAKQLLEEVNKPDTDFTEIMLANSEDPGSISMPEGYVFTNGQMVDEFYNGALNLKEGEISDIVESTYGYHIIKKIKQWDNGIPFDEIKNEVKASYNDKMFSEKLNNYMIESDVFYIKNNILNKFNTMIEKEN